MARKTVMCLWIACQCKGYRHTQATKLSQAVGKAPHPMGLKFPVKRTKPALWSTLNPHQATSHRRRNCNSKQNLFWARSWLNWEMTNLNPKEHLEIKVKKARNLKVPWSPTFLFLTSPWTILPRFVSRPSCYRWLRSYTSSIQRITLICSKKSWDLKSVCNRKSPKTKISSAKERRNLAVKSLRNSHLSTLALKRKPQVRLLQAQMLRKWWAPCSPKQPCPLRMWRVDTSRWRPASSKLTLSKSLVCKVIYWRSKQLQCSCMANSQTSNHSRWWQRRVRLHQCQELKLCQQFKCCSSTMRGQIQALTIRSARAPFASQLTPITCIRPLTQSYIPR